MLIKDEVYKFEIWYINDKKEKEVKTLYSDSADLYALEDVPQSSYCIFSYRKNLNQKQQSWEQVDNYWIGDEITDEDAEKEMELLGKLDVVESDYEYSRVIRTLYSLKAFCKKTNADQIFINKNINYDCGAAISARITILSAGYNNFKIISPSQIVNGKIYSSGNNIVARKYKQEVEIDKPYIDLE